MFEHRRQPPLSRAAFLLRLLRHALTAFLLVAAALGLGVFGYHHFEGLSWVDSILNASMILTGMGQVNELHTTGGKLFASAYALFSGIMFLTVSAVLFAPAIHRLLHRFHIEVETEGPGVVDSAKDE